VCVCVCACRCAYVYIVRVYVYVCTCVYVYYVCANMCVLLLMFVREGCNKWLGQLIPLFPAERSDEYFSVRLRIRSADTTEVTLTVFSSS
jgi:hypothetical protein